MEMCPKYYTIQDHRINLQEGRYSTIMRKEHAHINFLKQFFVSKI